MDNCTRMETYMGLAVAFERPHRDLFSLQKQHSLMNILSQQTRNYLLSEFQRPGSGLFTFLETYVQNNDDDFWQELEIEYNRLFAGPFSPKAQPYESTYINPNHQACNEYVQSICTVYDQENLTMKHDFHDLPDHIMVELEFMAILCERELEFRQNNKAEKVLYYLLKQYDFLMKHLGLWTSEFSRNIELNTDSPFYLSIAAVLREFISEDINNLRNEINKQEAKVLNSPVNARYGKDIMLPHRGRNKGQKEGFKLIAGNDNDCILCGVCVSGCPTKAFQITSNQDSVQLLFKAALCNRCEHCLAICPEHAIQFTYGNENANVSTSQEWIEVASAELTKCSGCGKVYFSEKMRRRVLASISKEAFGNTLLDSLSLCSSCKGERLMESCKRQVQGC